MSQYCACFKKPRYGSLVKWYSSLGGGMGNGPYQSCSQKKIGSGKSWIFQEDAMRSTFSRNFPPQTITVE